MSKIDQVDEFADGGDEELLLLGEGDERDRFEPAIIGIAHRFGMQPIVAYDYRKVIEVFAEEMGLPLGWTCVSGPLETESFQRWQLALSAYLARN